MRVRERSIGHSAFDQKCFLISMFLSKANANANRWIRFDLVMPENLPKLFLTFVTFSYILKPYQF